MPARLSQVNPLNCPSDETYPGMAGVSCPGPIRWSSRRTHPLAWRPAVGTTLRHRLSAVSSICPQKPSGPRHCRIVAAGQGAGGKISTRSRNPAGNQADGKCLAGMDRGTRVFGNRGAHFRDGGSPATPFFRPGDRVGKNAGRRTGHRAGRWSAGRGIVPGSVVHIPSTAAFLGRVRILQQRTLCAGPLLSANPRALKRLLAIRLGNPGSNDGRFLGPAYVDARILLPFPRRMDTGRGERTNRWPRR